jgi:GAF domain-containing protein
VTRTLFGHELVRWLKSKELERNADGVRRACRSSMSSDLTEEGPITESLLSLARILFAGQSVDETLDAVAHLAQQSIPGCDAASVTVMHDGRPSTTVSTAAMAWDVDQHQYDADEGPCLEAVRLQTIVRVDSYLDEGRWPRLVPAAIEHGVRSSLSLPLVALDEPVGALNLYSTKQSGFDHAEGVGRTFATQAAITLANAAALQRAAELARHLSIALERRDVIGQAKGILMAQSGMSSEEAFDVLRRASQRSNRKLHVLAEEMVQRHASPEAAE